MKIQDAYISIELKGKQIWALKTGLRESLQTLGLDCEEACSGAHVSIAYGQGEVAAHDLETALMSIAERGFNVRATGFELLRGQQTEYDYLVVSIEASGDMQNAVGAASGCMSVRDFEGGFKSHVSLLKFPKGELAEVDDLIRELNASHGAANALGRCLCLEGECVCVFNPERERCLEIPIAQAS